MNKKRIFCTSCKSKNTIKKGKARNVQTYLCLDCNKRFSGSRRNKIIFTKNLWSSYVFNKQTVRELSDTHSMDRRVIREQLNSYIAPAKIHNPRPVHIVTDGTYFGERKEGLSWSVIVVCDPKKREDLVWLFTDTETTYAYSLLRDELETLGYTILSVTGDGFGGIKTAFSGVLYQMCHVHMERAIIRGTTLNPQTEAGTVLLALARTLFQGTNSKVFNKRLDDYIEKYREFLNEKTFHPDTFKNKKGWSWTHEDLRRAIQSLIRHKPYLFTFEQNKNIPKNTNSLEGHFKHIKKLLSIHHGVSK